MIVSITKGGRALFLTPDTPPGQEWIYQTGFVLQFSPTEAGMFAGVRLGRTPIVDLEVGSDLICFEDLRRIPSRGPVPLTRYFETNHPRTGSRIYVCAGVCGGFVPLGAKRADGSPHPHAGTGYGLGQWIGFPVELESKKDTHLDLKSDVYMSLVLQQYAYDGEQFRITRSEEMDDTELIPGIQVAHHSCSTSIPSGDDLLAGLCTGNLTNCRSGLSRWQRGEDGCWRPIEYRTIVEATMEPSLVRDIDGSLLMSFRPHLPIAQDSHRLQIWRSADEGRSWHVIIDVKPFWQACPMILSRAADGTPFLALNRYREPAINRFAKREMIWAFPLSDNRRTLLDPIVVRDATMDFGPPPHGTKWRVDHACGTTVRLAMASGAMFLCIEASKTQRCALTPVRRPVQVPISRRFMPMAPRFLSGHFECPTRPCNRLRRRSLPIRCRTSARFSS